jgi:glycerol uptake facilitator-like aquaporin
MDLKLRMYLVELAGTFVLVLVGAGTVCAEWLNTPQGGTIDVTGAALAEGFALAVALTVTFPVSPGCLNPAITLMQWVFRKLSNRQAAALIGMQLLGAALAGMVLQLTFSETVLRDAHFGAPYLKPPDWETSAGHATVGSLISGTGLETFFAFVVTLAVYASLFDPRGPRVGGILVGLAQVAVILLGFRLTGGSANPARWLGPTLWQATLSSAGHGPRLSDTLIYAGGPILGALAAGFLYETLIQPPEKLREHRR